jgi:cytochrome c oxidase subunit 2
MHASPDTIGNFFLHPFSSASKEATDINSLFINYIIYAAFMAALVGTALILGAVLYRRKRRPSIPYQYEGSTVLETIWTIVPFIIVTYYFILAVDVMRKINMPVNGRSRPALVTTAHQWWWQMEYPEYGFATANELHIQAQKKYIMELRSADVVHDWWVPELGRKMDAVPGHPNYIWINAEEPGLYNGTCNEYCGAMHAWMRIRVYAQTPDEFQAWVENQKEVPPWPTDGLRLKGALLFQQRPCAGCHTIRGTPANGTVAPDLTHVASRATLLSGMLSNSKENIALWLKNPQKVKEGAHMPNFLLSPDEIEGLSSYLWGLK